MAILNVYINTDWDFSLGVLSHSIPLPFPCKTPNFSFEMIATQYWPPGNFCNQNKLTSTVYHKSQTITKEAHDCGTMIPDVTIPLWLNPCYAAIWPFSKRQIKFSSSTVLMDGAPTGCAGWASLPNLPITFPMLPMQTCGDPVSAPTAMSLINVFNTVKVGMSLADLLFGILDILISVAIDFIFMAIGDAFKNFDQNFKMIDKLLSKIKHPAIRELIQRSIGITSYKELAKSATLALTGFALSSIKPNSTSSEIKTTIGGLPFANIELGWNSDSGFSSRLNTPISGDPTPALATPNPPEPPSILESLTETPDASPSGTAH